MASVKYTIPSTTVGFGVTILGEPGSNVLKYYFEPKIELEVAATADSKEELQKVLDQLADEVISMVQNSVRAKATKDKQRKKEERAQQVESAG